MTTSTLLNQVTLSWHSIDHAGDMGRAQFSLPISIGRDPQNDLVFAELFHGVSRFHAQIVQRQGHLMILDLASTNGIQINGETRRSAALVDGQPIRIGNYQIQVFRNIECPNDTCHKPVAATASMCPWCGQFLADAFTRKLTNI